MKALDTDSVHFISYKTNLDNFYSIYCILGDNESFKTVHVYSYNSRYIKLTFNLLSIGACSEQVKYSATRYTAL